MLHLELVGHRLVMWLSVTNKYMIHHLEWKPWGRFLFLKERVNSKTRRQRVSSGFAGFLWTEAVKKKPLFQFVCQCFLCIVNKLWIIGALRVFPAADGVFSECSSVCASFLEIHTQKARKGATMGSLLSCCSFNCTPQKDCRLSFEMCYHWKVTERLIRAAVEVWTFISNNFRLYFQGATFCIFPFTIKA